MHSTQENIYRVARKAAGFTRESAAEHICTSVRSLADYETGKTIPGDDIVCMMAEVYKARWLGYMHLQQSTELGRKYLPELHISELSRSVLRFQKEVGDLKYVNEDMIEIACDGTVDQQEEERWNHIAKEVHEIIGAAISLIFSKQEMKLGGVGH
ncbi:MAG: helix-turn-helix domain protein [Anaerosolibacter sp.]|jgi:transcriptional regulator with XRE-family HTH domain|uniref:helix-turn-helix domain-containing protein n=1 Tax=Anaerosolibacter sp. TaxID=1872527 RepID=UPI0026386EE9|nr:helix-turn-helix transcriptional regulator [Anaerosolibacter sp.]MDF2548787.1 helix-turn-helix domain protein [Anaerosolibacter sp.]